MILLSFLHDFLMVTLVMVTARLILATWPDSFLGRALTFPYA